MPAMSGSSGENVLMVNSRPGISRRRAVKLAAASTVLPLVHIRTGRAAGKVSIFLWDHWVPATNEVAKKQLAEWGSKNQVEVEVDFITSNGFKNLLTINAEAQAQSGHDICTFPTWEVLNQAANLEPVDEIAKRLTGKYGNFISTGEYLTKVKGQWLAIPSNWGTQNKGPCGRISILKEAAGLDVVKMYPAKPEETEEAKAWTMDRFAKAAEACAKIGKNFGIGLGVTADSVDTAGSLFASFGAELVDAKGNITVDSDKVKHLLEYMQRLVKALPADAVSYDDASNNRALISGQAAMIFNPPSAWAVAVRDAPDVAKDCWTFPTPSGPAGRFMPINFNHWGIWKFSKNKAAAKELVEWLMQREQCEPRDNASLGYDIVPFETMTDFKIWETAGPPVGSVYNYPMRPHHHIKPSITGQPAPPDVAVQMYNRGTHSTMFAKPKAGQTIPQVIAWAKDEVEGFTR
jgi:ABC-type glycerol-3-phosphate transport system substrate-binding protein